MGPWSRYSTDEIKTLLLAWADVEEMNLPHAQKLAHFPFDGPLREPALRHELLREAAERIR